MRPVLSVLLSSMAGESQGLSTTQHHSQAPTEHSHCHRSIQHSGHVLSLCGHSGFTLEVFMVLKFKRLHEVKFSNRERVSSCG